MRLYFDIKNTYARRDEEQKFIEKYISSDQTVMHMKQLNKYVLGWAMF